MNQSGRPSRRHAPATGPVRLVKSMGQFTPVTTPLKQVDNFTAGSCLPASSLERPNIRSMNCNQNCPAGYAPYGYDGTQWNYGSACNMYNMICVKNNYGNDWKTVSDCCNGVTAQKDCDPALCRGSQGCRDKMLGICDTPVGYPTSECQTWLTSGENADMKAEILSKYCTADQMAAGQCRAFASSSASHGLLDSMMNLWCKGKIANPRPFEQRWSDFVRWRFRAGPEPPWSMFPEYDNDWRSGMSFNDWAARMEGPMRDLISRQPGATMDEKINATINPLTTYRDNSKDPLCACINSPLNKYGDKAAPPSCFDTSCVAGGYQTAGMKVIAAKCPSWVECRSTINAIAGGTNEQVNVQQICGGPAIEPAAAVPPVAPIATLPVSGSLQKDDKELLLDDESRALSGDAPVIAPIVVPLGLADQLNAPFMPGMFGDMSIGSVAILFFALVILSAILWRTWVNRRSSDLAMRLQAEQNLASAQTTGQAEAASEIQSAIQAQLSEMPRVGSARQ